MTSKIILDCESFEATVDSLAQIFQTTSDSLKLLLSQRELSTHYDNHVQNHLSFKDYIFAVTEHHFGSPLSLDAVCWFHTTRTLPGTAFLEGILPLNSALPQLKEMLIAAIDDVSIREQLQLTLNSGEVADFHYFNKTNNSMHWGPYAILIREVAFCAEKISQHDYLGMPEIIEDICNGFQRASGLNLIDVFSRKLQPAIVKFTSANNRDEICISTAISYVYTVIQGQAPNLAWAYCFNGENTPIPAKDILKVEFVKLALNKF